MNMPHVYKPDCTEPTLNLARDEFRLEKSRILIWKVEFWFEKVEFWLDFLDLLYQKCLSAPKHHVHTKSIVLFLVRLKKRFSSIINME